jgi:DNA topoisomerase-6 subunit B
MEQSMAELMAKDMKEISVAEFFEKNRHLLGYENSAKALLTVVKEGVENALDACEESRILPHIEVSVKEAGIDRFKIAIKDNGPGVIESRVPFAFAKFLFGSKFHRLKESRGIQGLGIHGAVMYAQLTTGKPVKVMTSTSKDIHIFELMIDVSKNEPKIISHKTEKNPEKWHGVKIEMEIEGKYVERYQSIPEYLKQTAIVAPYAHIIYDGPNEKVEFPRVMNELPKLPKEIKPHPYGVELGILRRMLASTRARNISGFLMNDFSRVGKRSVEQICKIAKVEMTRDPKNITPEESERLHKAMQMVKLIAPPTDCLSPLSEETIVEGLKKEIKADCYVAISRSPTVYRGYPFQVSVGLAYGGELLPDSSCQLFRFANKIPLLYNQGDCAITQTIVETDWRRYGLQQSSNSLPVGPLAVLVHLGSVWVPFTSEGKQAIAPYPEIKKEIKLALQDAARKLAKYIRQQRKAREGFMRRQLFERYLPEVAQSLGKLTGTDSKTILNKLEEMTRRKTDIFVIPEQQKSEEKTATIKQTSLEKIIKSEKK